MKMRRKQLLIPVWLEKVLKAYSVKHKVSECETIRKLIYVGLIRLSQINKYGDLEHEARKASE